MAIHRTTTLQKIGSLSLKPIRYINRLTDRAFNESIASFTHAEFIGSGIAIGLLYQDYVKIKIKQKDKEYQNRFNQLERRIDSFQTQQDSNLRSLYNKETYSMGSYSFTPPPIRAVEGCAAKSDCQ